MLGRQLHTSSGHFVNNAVGQKVLKHLMRVQHSARRTKLSDFRSENGSKLGAPARVRLAVSTKATCCSLEAIAAASIISCADRIMSSAVRRAGSGGQTVVEEWTGKSSSTAALRGEPGAD